MSTMKENVAKLVATVEMVSKEDFPKTPRGYSQRTNATLAQLCFHADPVVRLACATAPLLRDMFVIAMYERETDAEIKGVLEPRYIDACSKEQARDAELDAAKAEIESLKAALAQKSKRTR